MNREGFDRRQWWALVRTGLRRDLRGGGGAVGLGRVRTRGLGPAAALLLLDFVLGILVAALIWSGLPALGAATAHLTFVAFVVATSLVLDFGTTVISPEDHERLGYFPISPRTFFTARLSTLVAYSWALAFALSAVPLFAWFTRGGPHVLRGVAATAAVAVLALFCALAIVALYTSVQERVPPRFVRSALTLLQLTFSFVLYGSLILLPRLVQAEELARYLADVRGWQWLNPAAWFAAWVALADGTWRVDVAVAAVAALVVPLAAFALGSPRLSLEYASGLGAAARPRADDGRRRDDEAARWRPWRARPETRVVGLLVAAQFRDDMRFRLTVLAIVPLTVVYLLAGLFDEERGGDPFLVYFAAVLFAPMLKAAFVRSDAYRAAWVFYATPARLTHLMLALKNVIVARFLVPYVIFVGLLLTVFSAVPHVWLSLLLISLASHALLVADMFIAPQLPFSLPPTPGRQAGASLAMIVVTGPVALFVLAAIKGGFWASAGMAGVLIVLNLVLLAGFEARVRDVMARAEAEN
ncbi:MAG: hypothetical protein KJ061_09220 [Vicinamibacteraceae bacterium]|nr:hypothetical protein [Vicinamibacteraceae bacterium]